MSKILVIGSNSFAGASFTDYCLNQNFTVLGTSRSEEPSDVFLPYKQNKNVKNFKFVKADLNHDLEKIVSNLKDFQPDYIVDFAGQGMVAPSWQYPDHWYQTNLVSKVRLHDAIRTHLKSLKCFLRFTTPEVYGSTQGSINENAPFNPSTPYAVSQAAQDMSLKVYYNQYNFPVVSTRAANIYGPGQQLYRIVPRAVIYPKISKKLKLDGGGHSIRNFIYMNDVSEALLKILDKPKYGETFHISGDEFISIRELVEKICSKTQFNFSDVVEIGEDRPGKDQAYCLSYEKLNSTYGWKPKTSLDRGLDFVVKWVDQNIETIRSLPQDYSHKA